MIVEIVDNGPGIPSDLHPRIFEPFFTTEPPGVGTGLGLHIAYNIVVHKHHGRIQVSSRPGETRFSVALASSAGQKQKLARACERLLAGVAKKLVHLGDVTPSPGKVK